MRVTEQMGVSRQPQIVPVHTTVPGRARFKVRGLQRSETFKRLLEERLSLQAEIHRVTASTLTGNLLILFEADTGHDSIQGKVALAAKEAGRAANYPRAPSPTAKRRSSGSLPQASRTTGARPVTRVKDTLKRILSTSETQPVQPWHLIDVESVVEAFETDRKRGISATAAQQRLKRYGLNAVPVAESRSKWHIFADQFVSLPVALLGAAAGLSILTGGFFDAVVIAGVVLANAAIGYATESQSENTIQSLKRFVRPRAEVIRDGRAVEIRGEEVVVGDVLVLKPGTYVAADTRVVHSSHLSIDESVLTGESLPAAKRVTVLRRENTPLGDRVNIAYMGTLVTGGEGVGVVVATGPYTEMGRLQLLLAETTTPETPIERQLRVMGDQLVLLSGLICGVVFALGFLRGYGLVRMLRTGVSLAAAAVPEGLPAAATINFALGIKKLKKHHVMVRRLEAIETLGAVQTVCLDKTGTITQNRMSVLRVFIGMRKIDIEGKQGLRDRELIDLNEREEFRQILLACALSNEVKVNGNQGDGAVALRGTPTENALVRLAIHAGLDVIALKKAYRLLKVNHRSENRLFMSTLHTAPQGGRFHAVKGSPPEVLALCRWHVKNGETLPLTPEDRLEIERENESMAGEALRVLGVASVHLNGEGEGGPDGDLTWIGLVGMADPIRRGAAKLIAEFHRAQVDTVMITGDQSPTAYAVADRLKLSRSTPLEILDSSELGALDPSVLAALSSKITVYSRVSPAHKLKIVQALQGAGKTVAMTGDGINDGPALKAANIGIALGKSGTDVARDVADIVLEEDDLETLIVAMQDGRATYSNIRKSVHFFLSTNLSEIMVMFAAMALGIGFPLNVMQLLWINIISDIFPGLALSMEPPEEDILEQPPRKADEALISSSDFKRMTSESAFISAGALLAYGYGIRRYGIGPAAGSLAFQSLTLGQLLHAWSCRSERHSVLERGRDTTSNPYLTLAVGGSVALQMLTMFVPALRRFLGLTSMDLADIAVSIGAAALPFLANEETKTRSTDSDER